MKYDPPIIIESTKPTAAIIWLHGLGADGNDFVPILPSLNCDDLNIRFIFPHANSQPVSLNGGYPCRSWFDIHALEIGAQEDLVGLQAASDYVVSLIESQVEQGIPPNRILLVGFSQGGALALFTGLSYHQTLAGVVGLSTVLAGSDVLQQQLPLKVSPSIWLAHGDQDNVVPISLGEHSRQQLDTWGLTVDWHVYPMAHTVIHPEIQSLSQFIRGRLDT